jgi:glycerol kinase
MAEKAVSEGNILSLYQDTRGSMAVVMGSDGRLLGRSYAMTTQHRPQPDWVEYDPYEVWHRSWQAVEQACKAAGISRDEAVALGVATQQGTVVAWERATHRPIGSAISWRCARTSEICERLRVAGHDEMLRERTGGSLNTAAAGPKIQWLLDKVPRLRKRAERGEICCGTLDTWLLWNLTDGAIHATDWTNASSTLLFNLHTQDWDDELLDLFDVPRAVLPEVHPTGYSYGRLRSGPTPIAALCADRQASLFGQTCFDPGTIKVTYGRDAVALMEVGPEPLDTSGELRAVVVPTLDGESARFALEGQVLTAGVAIEWLRDELALIPTAADSEVLARQAKGSSEVYLVPAFEGLGAPYWDSRARGGFIGLTAETSRAHLVRAALEGVAYRVRDVVEAMARWTGQAVVEVRADGGAAANDFLLEFQADLLGVPVLRDRLTYAATSGAAYLAGLQVGVWDSKEQISALWSEDRRFDPTLDEGTRRSLYQGWQRAVRRLLANPSSED